MHMHTYTHTYTYTYTHTYTHTYLHIYIHTYTYSHIHTYTYTHIHTYIHTYIHTHTHTLTYIHKAATMAGRLFKPQHVPLASVENDPSPSQTECGHRAKVFSESVGRKKISMGLEVVLVKSTYCSCRELRLGSQQPHGSSEVPVLIPAQS